MDDDYIRNSFSQDFSMEVVKGMQPRSIGPGGMSGRVTAIDVVHSNPEIMYVGTGLRRTVEIFFWRGHLASNF